MELPSRWRWNFYCEQTNIQPVVARKQAITAAALICTYTGEKLSVLGVTEVVAQYKQQLESTRC